jgi:hypothetical protein
VNPDVRQLFVDASEDEPRSRLEPYREQILLWRRRGRTYKRIRQTLREECRITVAHATLFDFVQRRSRPRKVQAEFQPDEPIATPAVPEQTTAKPPGKSQGSASADRWAAARERMREDKQRPVVTPAPKPKSFTYTDEDCVEPIVSK